MNNEFGVEEFTYDRRQIALLAGALEANNGSISAAIESVLTYLNPSIYINPDVTIVVKEALWWVELCERIKTAGGAEEFLRGVSNQVQQVKVVRPAAV